MKNIEAFKFIKYVEKFKELNIEIMGLKKNEKIMHCIDRLSAGGKYFHPQWIVTDAGRVWSLYHNKWLTPQILKKEGNAYWGLTSSLVRNTSVYVHMLVLHYFQNESDKIALEEFGLPGVHAHHIKAIHIPAYLKGAGHREEKIKQCMKDNCKANLVYQEKLIDHVNDTLMANGGETIEEKNGTAIWSENAKGLRSSFYLSGKLEGNAFGTYYVYSRDEQGNLVRELVESLATKGTHVPENDIIFGKYKVNADENKEFVIEHKTEILDRIKKNPPKSKQYKKWLVLQNVSIAYALV